MTKKIDVDKIRSDLAASSLHFQPQPPIIHPLPVLDIPSSIQTPPKTEQPERTFVRSSVRPDEQREIRHKTRHPFDIFQDQLQSLREIQFQREKKRGVRPTLGELAQEAFDLYISKENSN